MHPILLIAIVLWALALPAGESQGAADPHAPIDAPAQSTLSQEIAIRCTAILVPSMLLAAREIFQVSSVIVNDFDGSPRKIIRIIYDIAITGMEHMNRVAMVAIPCVMIPILIEQTTPGV